MPGWLFKWLVSHARKEEERLKREAMMHGGTAGMEMGPGDRLDHGGLNIRIIKAQNGTIIEYTSRDDNENEAANTIKSSRVDRGPFSRKLYIVPEGVKLADAVLAVVALMRLE